jgi:hypothetical protein
VLHSSIDPYLVKWCCLKLRLRKIQENTADQNNDKSDEVIFLTIMIGGYSSDTRCIQLLVESRIASEGFFESKNLVGDDAAYYTRTRPLILARCASCISLFDTQFCIFLLFEMRTLSSNDCCSLNRLVQPGDHVPPMFRVTDPGCHELMTLPREHSKRTNDR